MKREWKNLVALALSVVALFAAMAAVDNYPRTPPTAAEAKGALDAAYDYRSAHPGSRYALDEMIHAEGEYQRALNRELELP